MSRRKATHAFNNSDLWAHLVHVGSDLWDKNGAHCSCAGGCGGYLHVWYLQDTSRYVGSSKSPHSTLNAVVLWGLPLLLPHPYNYSQWLKLDVGNCFFRAYKPCPWQGYHFHPILPWGLCEESIYFLSKLLPINYAEGICFIFHQCSRMLFSYLK